jgi:hypothetical protein
VLEFWKNPEFVRYVRAELRPMRALTAAIVVGVVCFLTGLGISSNADSESFLLTFYYTLLGGQFVLLCLWSTSTCAQSISREREMKTHDFQRTTRLTAGELVLGKLLGAPALGYFVVGCSLPVSLVSGFLAGVPLLAVVKTYVLLLATAIFLGLVGLWLSMQAERSNVAALAVILLWPLGMMGLFADSPFPGFAALSPYPALASIYGMDSRMSKAVVFERVVGYGWLTLALYATLGAWLALMLIRNLKKDMPEIRLLSRPQALGFVAYLNFLFYAFLKHDSVTGRSYGAGISTKDFCSTMVTLNALLLFIIGATMLTSHEDLRVWWRRRATGQESYWSERGLAWPWLALLALIAFSMLALQASFWKGIPVDQWPLGMAAFQMAVLLIFITRDLLFIQYCFLTRMRRPLAGGLLFLCLYYFAVTMLSVTVDAVAPARVAYLYALQPFYVLAEGANTAAVAMGAGLQVPVIALLLWTISRVLSLRPVEGEAA